jgi:hypothetical protein
LLVILAAEPLHHSDNPQTWASLGSRRENQQQTYVLASS